MHARSVCTAVCIYHLFYQDTLLNFRRFPFILEIDRTDMINVRYLSIFCEIHFIYKVSFRAIQHERKIYVISFKKQKNQITNATDDSKMHTCFFPFCFKCVYTFFICFWYSLPWISILGGGDGHKYKKSWNVRFAQHNTDLNTQIT